MKLKSVLLTIGCASLVLFAGCGKESASETARKERAAALRAEARTAEAQGNAIAAEAFYRQLLTVDPADASAHLSLANLSHDARKNYLDAIYHYQRYLDLQPESDKTQLVNDRLVSARTLLSNQMAAEIVAREQRALTAERDALQAQLSAQKKKVFALNKTVTERDETIEKLNTEVKRLTRLVEQLKTIEAETRASQAAQIEQARKELQEVETKPEKADTDDLVKAAREEADAILNMPDGNLPSETEEKAPVVEEDTTDEALRAIAEGAEDEDSIAVRPTPGRRYRVRPGDRYSSIAREAYGSAADWQRIRNANRSTANPDGRLYAGETIKIPK